jgi:hypothetical protein
MPNASQTLSLIVIADLCTLFPRNVGLGQCSTVAVDRSELAFTQGGRSGDATRRPHRAHTGKASARKRPPAAVPTPIRPNINLVNIDNSPIY